MFHVKQCKMFHVKQCKMFHVKQCKINVSRETMHKGSSLGGRGQQRRRLLVAEEGSGEGSGGRRRLLVAEEGSGEGSGGRSGAAERKRGGRRQTERLGWRCEGWRTEAKQSEATDRRPKPSKPRSEEQTKPEELQRPAPNEARSSRSRADRSGKLPPKLRLRPPRGLDPMLPPPADCPDC